MTYFLKIIKKYFQKYILKKDSHYYNLKKDFQGDEHRYYVGGMWDEIGKLQFNFLKQMGLQPEHKLIDVGCGSLRGGVHFIKFLNKNNYYGTDISFEIIKVGIEKELNLELKKKIKLENFDVNSDFELNFSQIFDYGIALSVFTHLRKKNISKCLKNLHKNFSSGKFYATFFIANEENYYKAVKQKDGVISFYDTDPYHYTISQIHFLAKKNKWSVEQIESFEHPRNQKMFVFKKISSSRV